MESGTILHGRMNVRTAAELSRSVIKRNEMTAGQWRF